MILTCWLSLLALQGQLPDSLDLQGALAYARSHRGLVREASAQVAAAKGAARDLRALPNPSGSYTYNESPPTHTVAVQQSFDWLLRRGANSSVGSAGIERAGADSAQTLADLEVEVRQAWYGVIAARRGRSVADQQLVLADSIERLSRQRLEAGDISAAEHDRLRLELVAARQTVSRARAAEAAAGLRLARAIAWPDAASPPALVGELTDDLDGVTATTIAVEDLPAVRSALADSIGAAARWSSLRAARVPLPSLELGLQRGDADKPGRTLWLFGLSLPLPVFNQGGGAVDQAAAEAAVASASLAEARLDARQRLETARVQLDETSYRARIARDSLLPLAASVRSRAARAFELGETGILPLLDALRAEREITVEALGDLVAFQEALAEWLALGGRSP